MSTIDKLTEEWNAMKAERDAAVKKLNADQWFAECPFCPWEQSFDSNRERDLTLGAHMEKCTKNKVAAVERERDELKAQLEMTRHVKCTVVQYPSHVYKDPLKPRPSVEELAKIGMRAWKEVNFRGSSYVDLLEESWAASVRAILAAIDGTEAPKPSIEDIARIVVDTYGGHNTFASPNWTAATENEKTVARLIAKRVHEDLS